MATSNYNDWQQEREQLLTEIRRLREENALLRRRLGIEDENGHRVECRVQKLTGSDKQKQEGPDKQKQEECGVQKDSAMRRLSPQDKVSLFRSLFRGREDVFARRWFSKTSSKGGYQPVCANEWNPNYCDKKRYKCAECPHRKFAPLDYAAVFNHLAGKDDLGRDVIGMYAISEDDKCFFICADFDDKSCEHGYKDDVLAYCAVGKE